MGGRGNAAGAGGRRRARAPEGRGRRGVGDAGGRRGVRRGRAGGRTSSPASVGATSQLTSTAAPAATAMACSIAATSAAQKAASGVCWPSMNSRPATTAVRVASSWVRGAREERQTPGGGGLRGAAGGVESRRGGRQAGGSAPWRLRRGKGAEALVAAWAPAVSRAAAAGARGVEVGGGQPLGGASAWGASRRGGRGLGRVVHTYEGERRRRQHAEGCCVRGPAAPCLGARRCLCQ